MNRLAVVLLAVLVAAGCGGNTDEAASAADFKTLQQCYDAISADGPSHGECVAEHGAAPSTRDVLREHIEEIEQATKRVPTALQETAPCFSDTALDTACFSAHLDDIEEANDTAVETIQGVVDDLPEDGECRSKFRILAESYARVAARIEAMRGKIKDDFADTSADEFSEANIDAVTAATALIQSSTDAVDNLGDATDLCGEEISGDGA